jgi:hypothetical protein
MSKVHARVQNFYLFEGMGKNSHIQDRRGENYQNKMTIYPGNAERKRLFNLRYEKRVAESIVAEYVLEQFFLRHSDEEIVAAIRARGHGLRRKRPSAKSRNT